MLLPPINVAILMFECQLLIFLIRIIFFQPELFLSNERKETIFYDKHFICNKTPVSMSMESFEVCTWTQKFLTLNTR